MRKPKLIAANIVRKNTAAAGRNSKKVQTAHKKACTLHMDVHAFFDLVISICIASGCIASGKGESLQFTLLLISPQEIRPHREPHGLSFSACAHSEGTYTPGQNTSVPHCLP